MPTYLREGGKVKKPQKPRTVRTREEEKNSAVVVEKEKTIKKGARVTEKS